MEAINDEQTAANYVIKNKPLLQASSTVTIYVSKGTSKADVTVPNIIGMTVAQASELLTPLKITIADITYDDYSDKPKDTILRCTPDVG